MKLTIPESIGGDLRLLPEDTYDVAIQDLFYGQSAAKQPKLTCKYVVRSECSDKKVTSEPKYISTIGENVLETFSLQPQALFNLNGFYKQVTGEGLPMGDFEMEEFVQLLKDTLVGAEGKLDLVQGVDLKGNARTEVSKRYFSHS